MRLVSKRSAAVTAAVLLALGGTAGIAWSYWSTTGAGTGSAATSVGGTPMTIAQVGSLSAMFPGDTAQDINVAITNSSAESAYISTVTVTYTVTRTPAAIAASLLCTNGDYALTTAPTVGRDIASGATYPVPPAVLTVGTIQFLNKTTNQDGCKGATVNLAFDAA